MDKTENSPVGRKITVEQAEACMRADSQFHIHTETGTDPITYRICDGTLQYEASNGWHKSAAGRLAELYASGDSGAHIAADPNGTFERLYGTLTFEQVGAALFRGETVKAAYDGECFIVKFNKNNLGSEIRYRALDWVEWYWKTGFSFHDTFKYSIYNGPHHIEPKTPDERIAELEARVAELEAGR